jgi:glycosyltransferase involved in cell wall biosynthesis
LRTCYGVPYHRIVVILNGVEDCFADSPGSDSSSERCGASSPKRVVTVSRLVAVKGLDVLLDAMRILVARLADVELHVVGGGPLKGPLERRADALGLTGCVSFHGQVDDVRPFLADADVFVLTSLSEGLGVAAIEAMSASCPVVAPAVGGLPEVVVHQETGLLVNPHRMSGNAQELDPVDLADALQHVLSNPARARNMGEAGRIRYEKLFTLGRFVQEYEAVYRGERH